MKKWWILVSVILVFGGCAAIKQAHEDAKTGFSLPVEVGDQTIKEQAKSWVDTLSMVPYVGTAAPIALPVLAWFLAWRKGRKNRLGQPVSANPITGGWGKAMGLEKVVQHIATVVSGLAEVGPEGSGLRRAWKVGISGILAAVVGGLAIPSVHAYVVTHPDVVASIAGISALFAGLEKELSKVLPVSNVNP